MEIGEIRRLETCFEAKNPPISSIPLSPWLTHSDFGRFPFGSQVASKSLRSTDVGYNKPTDTLL